MELVVLLEGEEVGRIRAARDRLTFRYAESWRARPDAYPLSLSMPLAAPTHGDRAVRGFLWGLLPDDEKLLERWGARFHVSARNPLALLAHVGEECAGAVQLARPEHVEVASRGGDVEWISAAEVEERLRRVREDHAATRLTDDAGQFSLAGAQAKIALLREDDRWGVPSGRVPTTHILKPPISGHDGHVQNEHLCLALAHAIGLPVARSTITRFGAELAIVVERYDRLRRGAELRRLHQEDLCQALGVPPTTKYQNEGGPTPARIAELLRAASSRPDEDVDTFLRALAFNWLVGGTDAHAKNFSLLHARGPRLRLAPLYDLASVLPYETSTRPLKLAMKIGGTYRMDDVRAGDWEKLARELGVDRGATLGAVGELADRVEARAPAVRDAIDDDHPILDRLVMLVSARIARCRGWLGRG